MEPDNTQALAHWGRDLSTDRLFSYPLNEDSVVVDFGGYRGDWSAEIIRRYNPHVFIFEPIREYFLECAKRFEDNSKVHVFNYVVTCANGLGRICKSADGSSMYTGYGEVETVEMRDVAGLALPRRINLVSINVEGGEYSLLARMVETGFVQRCQNIQVQFHNNYPQAVMLREQIRSGLAVTHHETYCYPFVWEAWRANGI